ncbi:MAG: aminotransferase class I/II-fold pyridoxal phosphate-dependent enzyme [Thaumarchaeota archaeon]|nr:aminotransferase class I/II-fold pyridoxal phosphate-dependent enzyme [Nitrososphaerota archaeon]
MKTSSTRRFGSRRLGLFADSAIRDMSILAEKVGAVNLAQGSPDFPAPLSVKQAAAAAIRGDHNQYEMTMGSQELREAVAAKVRSFNGISADANDGVTITCGSTEAITAAVMAFTDPGDRVIIPEPFYESYLPATILSGARAIHFRPQEPGYVLAEEELKAAFSQKPKAILLNTPNNPTGRVFTKKELGVVADLCEDYDVLAITDEIYEHIVYDGRRHVSLATIGNMHERTVTVSGLSKTFSITGWRIGYAVAEKNLTTALRTVHDYLTVCAATPLQRAAVTALALPDSYYLDLAATYDEKRLYLLKSLQELGFSCSRPEGAYYILADFGGISKLDDFAFASHLAREVGVAAVPASSFYANREAGRTKIRFTFTKKDATLREAVKRMRKGL